MSKLNALVYDLEIVRAIPDRDEPRIEGIEYCAGWGDYEQMGIAVLCCYDYAEDRYRVFCADNLPEFGALVTQRQPLMVSFNGIGFDNKVLAACAGIPAEPGQCYDIKAEIYRTLRRFAKGYSLDACAQANFGASKSGNGAMAPVWWQRGQVGRVTDYCMQDTMLARRLLDRIIAEGAITDPVTGAPLALRKPNLTAIKEVVAAPVRPSLTTQQRPSSAMEARRQAQRPVPREVAASHPRLSVPPAPAPTPALVPPDEAEPEAPTPGTARMAGGYVRL